MKNVFWNMLMAPESGSPSGGAGGAGTPDGEATPAGGAAGGGEPASLLAAEGGAAAPGGGKGEANNAEPASLLADAGGDGASGGDGAAPAADGKAPTAEEVGAYVSKIKQIDLGNGEGGAAPAWDAEGVKSVVPLFIKHKISDAAANEIIGEYGRHVSAQYKAAAEADRRVITGLHAECSKRFGADLKRFAAEGRRGGEHVFGKELFGRLSRVSAFGSDPDIIEALAKIGRGMTPDGAPGEGTGGGSEKTLAERMYGGRK